MLCQCAITWGCMMSELLSFSFLHCRLGSALESQGNMAATTSTRAFLCWQITQSIALYVRTCHKISFANPINNEGSKVGNQGSNMQQSVDQLLDWQCNFTSPGTPFRHQSQTPKALQARLNSLSLTCRSTQKNSATSTKARRQLTLKRYPYHPKPGKFKNVTILIAHRTPTGLV